MHLRKLNIDNLYDNMVGLFMVKRKVSENETSSSRLFSLKWEWGDEEKEIAPSHFRHLVSDKIGGYER